MLSGFGIRIHNKNNNDINFKEMNSIAINPYVFGALASVFIGVMGYFLGNIFSPSRNLNDTVAKLDNSITRLDTTISGMKEANTSFTDGCKERHDKINREIERIWDNKKN